MLRSKTAENPGTKARQKSIAINMPTDDKEIPVKIDVGIGAKAEVKLGVEVPEDVTRTVTERLVDALSPFTESMALVGDKLRLRRQETLLKIALRAKEIAAVRRMQTTSLSDKFLAHFLESASLESPDSPLFEKWAHLLVSAAQSNERNLTWCIRILDEIEFQEASLLNLLQKHMYPDAENYTRFQVEAQFSHAMERINMIHSSDLDDYLGVIHSVTCTFLENDIANFNSLEISEFDIGEQLLHLEALGLVWVFADKVRLRDQGAFIVQAVLTPLGMYFLRVVTGED